jgi:hypothetical protein
MRLPCLPSIVHVPRYSTHFNLHGIRFCISGEDNSASATLANDFGFFRCDETSSSTGLTVELITRPPPYREVPDVVATNYTPRNVSFTVGERTWLDYGGRALARWDREAGQFQVFSEDLDLQYEVGYLFLLSRLGEELDERSIHRLHAMALAYRGRAVLAVMPMGGGKSTLGASLLRFPELDFLSDDCPLIASNGDVHAYPLHLGLLPGSEGEIPAGMTRTVRRMEFGPKVLVSHEYFAHRVTPSAKPGIVFLGRRILNDNCRIEPAGRTERYRSMIADCVVGLGLFQGVEFVLRNSALEITGKAGVALSRFRAVNNLFRRSEVYQLALGQDRAHNAKTVFEFVKNRLG